MLILSAILAVADSGVALGMWTYPTQRAVYFWIPLILGPRALSLFITTYIFSNRYESPHVCACVAASRLLPETAAPAHQCAKQELHIKLTFVASEETYALQLT